MYYLILLGIAVFSTVHGEQYEPMPIPGRRTIHRIKYREEMPDNAQVRIMPFRSYYDIIGVKPTATQKEIETSYADFRELLEDPELDPANPDQRRADSELKTAYRILRNSVSRAQYDQEINTFIE